MVRYHLLNPFFICGRRPKARTPSKSYLTHVCIIQTSINPYSVVLRGWFTWNCNCNNPSTLQTYSATPLCKEVNGTTVGSTVSVILIIFLDLAGIIANFVISVYIPSRQRWNRAQNLHQTSMCGRVRWRVHRSLQLWRILFRVPGTEWMPAPYNSHDSR